MVENVYSNLKLFQFTENFNGLYLNKILAPVHVRIKPTNVCNHNCWFCAYRVDNLELGEDMNLGDSISQDKMREIVQDLIDMKVKAVTFSGGGEPLIYPHIVETIEKLGMNGIKVATLTNGSKLKNDVAKALAEFATWVRVSMDGWDDESLAIFRKTKKNEFSNIMKNIEDFAKLDSKCELGVSFIINEKNYEHIYDYCKRVGELGVDHVKLSGCVVSNDGEENNRYHEKFKNVVIEQIDRAVADLNTSKFQIINHYHDTEERFGKNYTTCPVAQMLTVIGANCEIYTCQDKAYTQSGRLGSIKERSFREFWFSEENLSKIKSINPQTNCTHHCASH